MALCSCEYFPLCFFDKVEDLVYNMLESRGCVTENILMGSIDSVENLQSMISLNFLNKVKKAFIQCG